MKAPVSDLMGELSSESLQEPPYHMQLELPHEPKSESTSELSSELISDTARFRTIEVESIRVLTGRIICEVRIADSRWRFTNTRLMHELCQRLPDLPHHACVNNKGRNFAAVMNETSLPHVLEHVAISLQVRGSSDDQASFQGTTEWIDETQGLARVQISFQDDLLALRSFNEALTLINDAVLLCSA